MDITYPWVLVACDTDHNGAVAVIRGFQRKFVEIIEVHDCPTKIEMEMVNGSWRPRQDAVAMDKLVDDLKIPPGTIVYVEEGGARPAFGAQASYVHGGNCQLWRGIFVAK